MGGVIGRQKWEPAATGGNADSEKRRQPVEGIPSGAAALRGEGRRGGVAAVRFPFRVVAAAPSRSRRHGAGGPAAAESSGSAGGGAVPARS
ncbi:hypothetical protein GCM10009730_05360 [Streptomyces albidochromogenes]